MDVCLTLWLTHVFWPGALEFGHRPNLRPQQPPGKDQDHEPVSKRDSAEPGHSGYKQPTALFCPRLDFKLRVLQVSLSRPGVTCLPLLHLGLMRTRLMHVDYCPHAKDS